MVDYAGAELEIDFQNAYGIDLHDYPGGVRPWPQFLRFAQALPTASRYKNKLLKDRDLAALMPEVDDAAEPDLDFVDETPVVAALRSVQDQLNYLIYVAARNPEARIPAPLPRPRSAAMVLKEEAVQREVDAVVFAMTGQTF